MTPVVAALLVALVAIAALVATAAVTMNRVHAPTTGPTIDRRSRSGAALLLVDLQTDFVDGNGYDAATAATAIEAINARAAEARAAGIPVATLRQVYRGPVATTVIRLLGKGLGNPGSHGLGLHRLVDVQADADFVKSRSDGFSNPALDDWLAAHDIGTVEIVGLDGCYCVRKTAIGALNRGFDVSLPESMILAADESTWEKHRRELVAAGADDGGPR